MRFESPRRVSNTLFALLATVMATAPVTARAQAVVPDDAPGGSPPPAATSPAPPMTPPPAPPAPPPGYVYPGYPGPDAPPAYGYPGYAPQPVRYELVPRWSLFGTGIGLFGSLYVLDVFVRGLAEDEKEFYVPIAGPVLYAAAINNLPSCESLFGTFQTTPQTCATDADKRMTIALSVLDFLGQLTGATIAVAALSAKQKVPVREPRVTLAPSVSPSLLGVMATGRF